MSSCDLARMRALLVISNIGLSPSRKGTAVRVVQCCALVVWYAQLLALFGLNKLASRNPAVLGVVIIIWCRRLLPSDRRSGSETGGTAKGRTGSRRRESSENSMQETGKVRAKRVSYVLKATRAFKVTVGNWKSTGTCGCDVSLP